jgi:hypothetical protein
MRKTLIALALLATTPAAAQSTGRATTLPSGHVVCRNLEQAMAITDSPTVQAGTDLAMRGIQTGECIMLPKGESVMVRYREGQFSCVSPVAGGQCGWTLLGRRR